MGLARRLLVTEKKSFLLSVRLRMTSERIILYAEIQSTFFICFSLLLLLLLLLRFLVRVCEQLLHYLFYFYCCFPLFHSSLRARSLNVVKCVRESK